MKGRRPRPSRTPPGSSRVSPPPWVPWTSLPKRARPSTVIAAHFDDADTRLDARKVARAAYRCGSTSLDPRDRVFWGVITDNINIGLRNEFRLTDCTGIEPLGL
jgi:hypothetical protein